MKTAGDRNQVMWLLFRDHVTRGAKLYLFIPAVTFISAMAFLPMVTGDIATPQVPRLFILFGFGSAALFMDYAYRTLRTLPLSRPTFCDGIWYQIFLVGPLCGLPGVIAAFLVLLLSGAVSPADFPLVILLLLTYFAIAGILCLGTILLERRGSALYLRRSRVKLAWNLTVVILSYVMFWWLPMTATDLASWKLCLLLVGLLAACASFTMRYYLVEAIDALKLPLALDHNYVGKRPEPEAPVFRSRQLSRFWPYVLPVVATFTATFTMCIISVLFSPETKTSSNLPWPVVAFFGLLVGLSSGAASLRVHRSLPLSGMAITRRFVALPVLVSLAALVGAIPLHMRFGVEGLLIQINGIFYICVMVFLVWTLLLTFKETLGTAMTLFIAFLAAMAVTVMLGSLLILGSIGAMVGVLALGAFSVWLLYIAVTRSSGAYRTDLFINRLTNVGRR